MTTKKLFHGMDEGILVTLRIRLGNYVSHDIVEPLFKRANDHERIAKGLSVMDRGTLAKDFLSRHRTYSHYRDLYINYVEDIAEYIDLKIPEHFKKYCTTNAKAIPEYHYQENVQRAKDRENLENYMKEYHNVQRNGVSHLEKLLSGYGFTLRDSPSKLSMEDIHKILKFVLMDYDEDFQFDRHLCYI